MVKAHAWVLLIFTFIAGASQAGSGPLYESQLVHQMPRFLGGISEFKKTYNVINLNLVFLAKEKSSAAKFAKELGRTATIDNGKWLGYSYRITTKLKVNLETTDMEQWLRKYFFLGIAYHCDLDGWFLEGENAL